MCGTPISPSPVPLSLSKHLPLASLPQGELGEMGLDGIDGEEVSNFKFFSLNDSVLQ